MTAIQSVWTDPEGCYNRWRERLIELGGHKVHLGVTIPALSALLRHGEGREFLGLMLLGESDKECIKRMAREAEQFRRNSRCR